MILHLFLLFEILGLIIIFHFLISLLHLHMLKVVGIGIVKISQYVLKGLSQCKSIKFGIGKHKQLFLLLEQHELIQKPLWKNWEHNIFKIGKIKELLQEISYAKLIL